MAADDARSTGLVRHRRFTDPRSTAATREYRLGDVTVAALSDGFIVMDHDFIGSPAHPTAAHDALQDAGGELVMPIGCFLVQGEQNVLIDLGYGPSAAEDHATIAGGNLLAQLRARGLGPDDVDIIALSHLHPDHAGWIGDAWGMPVFPRARVVVGAADWEYFVESADALLPLAPHLRHALGALADHGRVSLEDPDVAITPQITRIAAPGHTPGHAVFDVRSGEDRMLILGDAMYCIEQLTELDWGAVTDVDPAGARRTRDKLARRLDETGGLALGCHFPSLDGGRLVRSTMGA